MIYDFLYVCVSFWCAFLKLPTESPVSGRRKVLCSWSALSVCLEADWWGGEAETVLFLKDCTSPSRLRGLLCNLFPTCMCGAACWDRGPLLLQVGSKAQ